MLVAGLIVSLGAVISLYCNQIIYEYLGGGVRYAGNR